ncbi:hypothetical protein RND71_014735 [Anisodus tanguticus]|uniref:Uncharacterized protein n=1 Tax=Anisodus tanguticus TaxID=243964 RepID=A0AAE1SB62_9SOLA|nr:hypothetical protein RND71_014735 [Anisodus tanguticus]
MNFGENMESNVDFHIQDEAERLLKEIEQMTKNVENSKLYAELRFDIEQNETLQKYLFRLLGSHSHVEVVIYALGSMEYSFHSQFQLAVVLLLKRDFSNWIGNIEVYDPIMSPADIIVFKKVGLEVLTIDEDCKRQVRRPTMFYMPYPNYYHIGNLLGANWSPSCVNQILLLTNSFHRSSLTIYPDEFNRGQTRDTYTEQFFIVTEITEHTKNDKGECSWLDTQRFLEEDFFEALQINISSREFAEYFGGYRGPRRLRYNKVPPPPDMYTGTIDVEDNVIVGLEALRNGLIRCVEGYPKTQKLIVESDNVILVQYVNRCPEPTEITMSKLKEIFDLLERIPCAIYHVYEEANEVARDWALSLVEFN